MYLKVDIWILFCSLEPFRIGRYTFADQETYITIHFERVLFVGGPIMILDVPSWELSREKCSM